MTSAFPSEQAMVWSITTYFIQCVILFVSSKLHLEILGCDELTIFRSWVQARMDFFQISKCLASTCCKDLRVSVYIIIAVPCSMLVLVRVENDHLLALSSSEYVPVIEQWKTSHCICLRWHESFGSHIDRCCQSLGRCPFTPVSSHLSISS